MDALFPFALCLLSLLIGLGYVTRVPVGLPYDEPAHYYNVLDYSRLKGLPVMQKNGSYEAYQAPLYYSVNGIVARIGGTFLTPRQVFYAIRTLSLLLMVPIIGFSYAIARVTAPRSRSLAFLTAAFVALNPSLLAITSSVQNDGLAIALSLGAIWLMLHCIARDSNIVGNSNDVSDSSDGLPQLSLRHAMLLGCVVAAAVMTKLSAAFLVVAIPLFYGMMQHQAKRHALGWISVFLLTFGLLTFWWFARNSVIYGDATGADAMQRLFPEGIGPKLTLNPRAIFGTARSVLTYLWIPVEYFRNELSAPAWMRALILGATALALAGWLFRWRANSSFERTSLSAPRTAMWSCRFLLICYAVCMAIYLWNGMTHWVIPARITLTALIAPALFLSAGWLGLAGRESDSTRLIRRGIVSATVAVLLILNFYFVIKVQNVPTKAYTRDFSASLEAVK